MNYHIAALILGFLLDCCLGDPHSLPHPVRWIGSLISRMECCLRKDGTTDARILRCRGRWMTLAVVLVTGTVGIAVILAAYTIHPLAGLALESVLTYQVLAARSLQQESMKVYAHLKAGDTEDAREAVSMIVGRDTDCLDEAGIVKAAVETVAENTSDGVIAPLLYTAIGGPAAGLLYKAVNTLDSMVGYQNEAYLDFGRCAAKLDDLVNYLPSRISAGLMIAAAWISGSEYSGPRALRIYRRDRRNHSSPNSAQTEAVVAGALGIRLGGTARYFGKMVEKPTIGDSVREVEPEDIPRANRLMYRTTFLCLGICLAGLLIVQKLQG